MKFESLVVAALNKKERVSLTTKRATQIIKKSIDFNEISQSTSPEIAENYREWTELTKSQDDSYAIKKLGKETLGNILEAYFTEPEYEIYAQHLRPHGLLYQDVIRKIDEIDAGSENLQQFSLFMISMISFFDRVSRLENEELKKSLLASFPMSTPEEYACVGGAQSRLSNVMLSFGEDPVTAAFHEIISDAEYKLLRLVNTGNQPHLASMLQKSLGFQPRDHLWHTTTTQIPAQIIWELLKNYNAELQRRVANVEQNNSNDLIIIAKAFDDLGNYEDYSDKHELLKQWKETLSQYPQQIGKLTELDSKFFKLDDDGKLLLDKEVVTTKLQQLVNDLKLYKISTEKVPEYNLHDEEFPNYIARTLQKKPFEDNYDRWLALSGLWILSENFPGNSQWNFIKTVYLLGAENQRMDRLTPQQAVQIFTKSVRKLDIQGLLFASGTGNVTNTDELHHKITVIQRKLSELVENLNNRNSLTLRVINEDIMHVTNFFDLGSPISLQHFREIMLNPFVLANELEHDVTDQNYNSYCQYLAKTIFYHPDRKSIIKQIVIFSDFASKIYSANSKIIGMTILSELAELAIRKQDYHLLKEEILEQILHLHQGPNLTEAILNTQVDTKRIVGYLDIEFVKKLLIRGVNLDIILDGKNFINILNNSKKIPLNMRELVGDHFLEKEEAKFETAIDSYVKDAIFTGNIKALKKFVDSGFDLNRIIKKGTNNTILHEAILYDKKQIVKFLVENDVNINAQHICDGSTPIHMAIHQNNIDILKIFCEKDCDLNIADNIGNTAFDLGLYTNMDLAILLLNNGANICKTRFYHNPQIAYSFHAIEEEMKEMTTIICDINNITTDITPADLAISDKTKLLLNDNGELAQYLDKAILARLIVNNISKNLEKSDFIDDEILQEFIPIIVRGLTQRTQKDEDYTAIITDVATNFREGKKIENNPIIMEISTNLLKIIDDAKKSTDNLDQLLPNVRKAVASFDYGPKNNPKLSSAQSLLSAHLNII